LGCTNSSRGGIPRRRKHVIRDDDDDDDDDDILTPLRDRVVGIKIIALKNP
jgi:hypothetical protein